MTDYVTHPVSTKVVYGVIPDPFPLAFWGIGSGPAGLDLPHEVAVLLMQTVHACEGT